MHGARLRCPHCRPHCGNFPARVMRRRLPACVPQDRACHHSANRSSEPELTHEQSLAVEQAGGRRRIRAALAVRCDRQWQDRGLPVGDRADALAARPESQALLLVPEINLTPQLESQVRARFPALRRGRVAQRTRGRGAGGCMAGGARGSRARGHRHAPRGLRFAAAPGAHRRRRGTRSVVQGRRRACATRRAISR